MSAVEPVRQNARVHWQIDLVSLRLFVAVCEEGSITRAASRAFIAASAVSKRMAELEAGVGTPLFRRSQRGMSPTDAGRALLRHACHLLASAEHMRAELSQHGDGVRGSVRLLANISALAGFLPDALADFLIAHPHIRIDTEEAISADIVNSVRDGAADIGICRDVVATGDLEIFPHRLDEFMVVMPHDHPMAHQASISFEETLAYEQVVMSTRSPITAMETRMAANLGQELRYRLRLPTLDAALQAVRRGLGIALLPREAVLRQATDSALRILPLRDAWARRRLLLCVRKADELGPAARQLFDHLHALGPAPEP